MRKFLWLLTFLACLATPAWGAEIGDLNVTDASNTTRFPENMSPGSVNDSARALEGLLARGFKDAVESNLTSAGSANAYTLTPNRTLSAYYQGMRFQFIASFANTGAATLNVSSIGAKNIYKPTSSGLAALASGDIRSSQVVDVLYDGTQFVMLSPIGQDISNDISNLTIARIKTGSYTGDGTTSQAITGVGFQPKYVRIWPRETADSQTMQMMETTDTIIDDNGSGMAVHIQTNGVAASRTNRIISLDSDGFTVDDDGADSFPNTNGVVYNYLAEG